MSGVAFSTSKTKWFAKFRSIPSWWRDGGKWVHRYSHYDKRADTYSEVVTDLETGEVIHECDEPLSAHTGHGGARDEGA